MLQLNQRSSNNFWKKVLTSLILTAVVLCAGVTNASAKGPVLPLFRDVPGTTGQYDKVQADPTIIRSRPVLGNFEFLAGDHLPEGAEAIVLNLFDDVTLTAVRDRLQWRSPTVYTWFGRIAGEEHSQVILVFKDGNMAGNITIKGQMYQIRAAGGGVHSIREIDQSAFPDDLPPIRVEALPGEESDFSTPQPKAGPCPLIIDVMVVYTQDAATACGDIDAEILLAIDGTNLSYERSDIAQRLRLVHSAQVAYTETGDSLTDIDRLQNPSDGFIDNVHALRDTYGADCVSFWLESMDFGVGGMAYLMETVDPSFESYAFSIVKGSSAGVVLAFAHELGHNMSANHDWYVNEGTDPYVYSHGHVDMFQRLRTIMAFNDRCADAGFYCSQTMHWSNPDVLIGGNPSGVAGDEVGSAADNARVLDNTASTVANFRPRTVSMNIFVDTSASCPGSGVSALPYCDIQTAIDCAQSGDTVIVRDGTYTGANNKSLSFGGKAITLRSENGPANCIIDCEFDGRGFNFQMSDTSSVVDGFTITNGSPVTGYPTISGGAIYCGEGSGPTITNCVIKGNRADVQGGGIYCYGASPAITNCIIIGNSAGYSGGGIYCWEFSSPTITNCTISGNVADDDGGGIYCAYSFPTITNCTISGNVANDTGGGIYCSSSSWPTITNCILWDDSPNEVGGGSPTISYSDVEGGYAGAGNINANPLFLEPGHWNGNDWVEGDYHLTASSPCIDTGTDSGVYTDIDGEGRPSGDGYDMGSYEFIFLNVGSEPSDDFTTIQEALDAIAVIGIVTVRDGTYSGNLDFNGKIIGLRSENGPDNCIIDCEFDGRGFSFTNGETSTTVVDGFTIINGLATGTWPDHLGGGIYCSSSSPTITNCIISGNSASSGGGIYCGSSSPTIINCTISGNSANSYGGGVYCSSSSPTITNCIISGNVAHDGGGIYCSFCSTTITNCTISENVADWGGGGIYCSASSTIITNCNISANSTDHHGGGIYCSSSSTITNCNISGNLAGENGGGIYYYYYPPTIINCTISGNSANINGGGIFCNQTLPPSITNCTFSANSAGTGGGIYCYYSNSANITNCILWGDSAGLNGPEIALQDCTATVSCSDVEGGQGAVEVNAGSTLTWGAGNIDADPLFVEPGHWDGNEWIDGDYHLTGGSPCIDTGMDAGVYADIDGDIRPQATGYDMGSDEVLIFYVGSEPSDDFSTIQAALDAATDRHFVIVRDGVYTGAGNKNLDFGGKATVLRSENGPANCIIDCQYSGRAFYFHSGETASTVVDGFTIVNGNDTYGGGIYCENASSPTICNCVISGNSATADGGGICCDNASPTVTSCVITGNSAHDGGGICCDRSSSIVTNCIISGNSASFFGGGVIITGYFPSPAFINCTITGNSVGDSGGGFFCMFASPTITNCTISGNVADDDGGGIFCAEDLTTITNCIVWGDSPNEIFAPIGVPPSATYSNVQGGYAGTGNIDADPLFVEPGHWNGNEWVDGNYHLTEDSPCIDVGTDAGVYMDMEGEARPLGAGYDMGSDEFITLGVGSDPSDDYPTIQEAIDAIAGAGLIIVRDGVYAGSLNKDLDYGGKAITIRSENGPENCIIDCGGVGRGFHFHSGETSSSVVDGFTIINGDTIYGGGIYCESSSPTITNCVISDNWADYGGGICCDFASPTITACTISGNAADFRGGGIECYDNSSPAITNCVINDNTAVYGGAICCYWYCSPSVTNCTTSANWANYGGSIACYYSSSPTITNCIMWGDGADNGDEIVVFNGSSPSVGYSDVEGGQGAAIVDFFTLASLNWLAGNIDPIGLDPEFVNPTVDDYHLQCGSPCIDAGDPGSDYSNEPEPNGGRINMGAYGNTSEAATSEICPAHGDWFVSVPNFGGGTADELAVLGVAKSTGAIMAQTKDATGGSSLADTDYLSAAWEPFGMAVVSDFAGGAADEIAALATDTSSGSVIVQVKDATGGAVLASTYYLSAGWNPEGLAVVSDFGGGVSDELAVLATADSSGAVIVQVKDATGGAVLASTYYLSSAWDPKGLAVVPDFGGGASDELAVLAVDKSSGAVIVQVKDATGGAALASTYYLSSAWKPVGLTVVPDFGGGASDELAVLAVDKSSGAVIAQVKDATGGAALASTYYLSSAWKPVGLAVVPDFGGGASDELALLAVNRSSGEVIVQVRDATGGAVLASTYYLTASWDARAIEVVADFSGGADELAVLAVGKSSGAITVEVRDATGGAALATTSYLNAGWNTQP